MAARIHVARTKIALRPDKGIGRIGIELRAHGGQFLGLLGLFCFVAAGPGGLAPALVDPAGIEADDGCGGHGYGYLHGFLH